MSHETVTLEDAKNTILIDVREAAEFAGGCFDNAHNIPLSKLCLTIDVMQTFDKTETYVLYCVKGMRAQNAAQLLSDAGYSSVKLLDRGYA